MSEETKKGFLTEEQLEIAVNTFINGFKKIVQDNTKEVDVEVKEEDENGNVTGTKIEKQKRIFDIYEKETFENIFKFTKNDYKFSIENFKEKAKTNKVTISDIAIEEIINIVFTHHLYEKQITNYINIEANKQTKQKIFDLFKTLINSLIDDKVIIKDFFKDKSSLKIGRIFSILAIYSPNDENFTELKNKLLPHIDEKDKKNVLSYEERSGSIGNKEKNATYFLLENPDITYDSVQEIVKSINTDNQIENLVTSMNIQQLLKLEHVINNQEKSKQLIDLFFKLLEQDLRGNNDEVKEYFSSSIDNHGGYSNFLLQYSNVYDKISNEKVKTQFINQFNYIISKLKKNFGKKFVIDLLSGITIESNKYTGKTEFNFLNIDLIEEGTIRDEVNKKITQKRATLEPNNEGKIEKFEELSKLRESNQESNQEQFKQEFLKLESYDEKMAYLYYVSDLLDLYNGINIGLDEDDKNNLKEYKKNIKTISECDPEFTVNFMSNIYKNTDSNKSTNNSSLTDKLIHTNINIPQVLLNYNKKAQNNEIGDRTCIKIKELVSKYNIIENISFYKSHCQTSEDTSQTVIDILTLINELYGYDELKNALIYNRTSSGSMEIFTSFLNPKECNYNTFKQIINLTIKSAEKAGKKNPYEELVNDILPHFGGEKNSFRHKIFKLASFDDIKKYLDKVKKICDNYDKEKSQTEGTSFSNLLLNNYGANIFDLMNNRKTENAIITKEINELAIENYKQIKKILDEKLYIELVSRSKNEDAKNILEDNEKNKIQDEQKTRENLINEMVNMVQTQNVDGIKDKLSKMKSEDEKFELLHSVFNLCRIYVINPINGSNASILYLNSDKYKKFKKKYDDNTNDYRNIYSSYHENVMDYDKIINTVSDLIDDEKYKILASKLCKNKVVNACGYNLMADALSTRDDIIKDKETYYNNILNILSKLEKEDLIYILNQRNYNGNSENLLCSLINGNISDIDYIMSIVNIIYNKIGHDEFQKIMGNKAVVSNFKYKVEHSHTLNPEEDDKKNKANLVKNFMSSIQNNINPTKEVKQQMEQAKTEYKLKITKLQQLKSSEQPKSSQQPKSSVQSIPQQTTEPKSQPKLTEDKPIEHKPIEQPEPSVQSIHQQQRQSKLTQPKPTQSLTQQSIPQQAATQPNSQLTSQSQTQPKSTQSSTLQTIQQPKATTYKNTEIHPSKTTPTTEKDETNLVRNNTIKSNNKNNNNELLKFIILMSAMNYINANRGRNINPIELMLNTVFSVVCMMKFCGSMFGINNNMTNPMEIMQEVMKTTFEIMPTITIMTTIRPKVSISTINNKQQKLNNLRKASGDFNVLVNGIGRMNYLS